jgi:peptidyl-prolyl cis-trans isomerase C
MKRLNYTALLLLSWLLTACGQAQAPATPVKDPIATINGKAISRTEFDMYVESIERQGNGRKLEPEERSKALDRFVGMHLAAEAAAKRGLDKEQKIADELSFARTKVLSETAMQRYLDEHPVKDEELQPAYDEGVAALPPEYHTRHILVDNPGTAEELIAKLKGKSSADFAKLAKEKSMDTSKEGGGDIGWLVQQDMLPEYAAAVEKLKPGEITQTPVKTRFGWHVIRLEEKRKQEVDPFEKVKDKVVLLLKRKRIESYLETLRKEAKVDVQQRAPKS